MALLFLGNGEPSIQARFGPANLHLLTDEELIEHFTKIEGIRPQHAPPLTGIVVGMAGVRREADCDRIRTAACKVWPNVPCYATSDLETALAADDCYSNNSSVASVLILSGTGSCCFGRRSEGSTVRFGGWGHILGDKGSGFDIGMQALKTVVHNLDAEGKWTLLGQMLLQALQLNDPEDLIDWVKRADKSEVSALALPVFAAAGKRDKLAADILSTASSCLATDAVNCARRLTGNGEPVQFIFAGSILLKQPAFARQVRAKLMNLWPSATVKPLDRPTVFGTIELARQHFGNSEDRSGKLHLGRIVQADIGVAAIPESTDLSPTEQRNPRSENLDRLPLVKAVELMISEEACITRALLQQTDKIAQAIQLIVKSFKRGGRLFYVGAGTSGRLAILDSSECPPTFCTPPERVQGIIAGGHMALWKAVEGAEDDSLAGARAVEFRGVNSRDVLVGIAASGRTPFVWGSLAEARKRGATTILLCFNPNLRIKRDHKPDLVLAFNVGPEVLTGSTRLKAGTATKLVLNILSTLSMVRMGKVTSNLMTDLNASNLKLRERAVRIVQAITGADAATARASLEKNKWVVRAACNKLR